MNKLFLLCLLSILILYTQCSPCTEATVGTNTDAGEVASCDGLTFDTTKAKSCIADTDNAKKCKEVLIKCKEATTKETAGKDKVTDCTKLAVTDSSKYTCAKTSGDSGDCTEVSKPATNSGSILNAFKITFVLIIIFAIL